MEMRKKLFQCLVIAVVFLISATTMAQTSRVVTGAVTDSEGYTLPGVNVVVQGTTIGTITDIDGQYSLNVPDADNAVLLFSFIGFNNAEIHVGNLSVINIVMEDAAITLDEIVAVGYGTMRRSDLTGSIASVEGEDIQKRGTVSPIEGMQGSVPGLTISSQSARPGGGYKFNIRGLNTMSSSGGNVLFVVDGVTTSNIDFLNPADIVKVDILKDASSTAIYGSRGSNGVVIIQTKSADQVKKGTATVSYDGYYGVRKIARMPDWMDGWEFNDYRTMRFYEYGLGKVDEKDRDWLLSQNQAFKDYDPAEMYFYLKEENSNDVLHQSDLLRDRMLNNDFTNWADLVTRTGHQQNHFLTISGMSDDISYTLGVGYQNEKGNMIGEELDRYNIRLSAQHKASEYFSAGGSFNASIREVTQGSENGYREGFRQNPLVRPFDDDGNYHLRPGNRDAIQGVTQYTDSPNPLLDIASGQEQNRRIDVIGKVFVDITPIRNLEFRSSLAPHFTRSRRGLYFGEVDGGRTTSIARNVNSESFSYAWDNVLTYTFDSGGHQLIATAINSIEKSRNEGIQMQAEDLPFDSQWYNLSSGEITTTTNTGSSYSESSLLSYAARLNYSYLGKYMATATMRYDGSSKLANNQWESFPSVALAWRMSEERFMQELYWLSNLKWRVSYGYSGNHSGISAFGTQNTPGSQAYYDFNGNVITGFRPSDPVNANITWEKTKEYNFGLDFGVFNNRINGAIEAYDRLSDGLIFVRRLVAESGVSGGMLTNIGSASNKGIEIELNTVNVNNRNFTWNTSFIFSKNVNKIVDLYGDKEDDIGNNWFIGDPINVVYNYDYSGVWTPDQIENLDDFYRTNYGWTEEDFNALPAGGLEASLQAVEGTPRFIDLNGDGYISSPEDKKVLGTPDGKWIGSFQSSMRFKNFDFAFNIYTHQGILLESPFLEEFGWTGDRGRMKINYDYYLPAGVPVYDKDLNWVPSPGKTGKHPINVNGMPNIANYTSYAKITDASFVKVQNIILGYTLPTNIVNRVNISSLRVYMNILNPFVWTDYEGYDPEYANVSLNSGNGPSNITYQFGVNVKF